MAFMRRHHPVREIAGWLCGGILLLTMIITLVFGVLEAGNRSRQEELRLVEQNVRRVAVQCYALDGFYPPSVDYMEEHLGLVVDHEKYAIHYEGFASNILPEITVVLK